MLALVFWTAAVALAFLLGQHDGRERERRRVSAGNISQWEMELLRSRGNRIHPDPSAAGRASRARISR